MDATLKLRGTPFAAIERIVVRLNSPSQTEIAPVADAARAGFAESFANEGSAAGPWRALAPFTVGQRIKLGFPGEHPILVRTGQGRNSFTRAGAAGHVERTETTGTGWRLTVGSELEKMNVLIRGGTTMIGNRRATIPPRPVQPFTGQAISNIRSAIEIVARRLAAQESRNG